MSGSGDDEVIIIHHNASSVVIAKDDPLFSVLKDRIRTDIEKVAQDEPAEMPEVPLSD